jgi:tRNA pseudouridine55 synthase
VTGGVLVLDKPAGPTSFDAVRRVRRALGAEKAGHAGTLDPAATGVLVVCLDEAVKLQRWLAEGDKAYLATVAFGAATETEDAAGAVVATGDPALATPEAISAALPGLVGEIDQVPPMYSAVRVGGRRLFEAARAGEQVERTPRRVRVHALDLLEFSPPAGGLALARVAVRCGKGTYVRTLAAELGRRLGVPAHLAALRRTEASGFDLSRAMTLDEVVALGGRDPGALRARLVPPAEALGLLPAVHVDEAEARDLARGRVLARPVAQAPFLRALDASGRLVAVLSPAPGGARPVRVFRTA